MACCMNSNAMSMPNNSPLNLVNLSMKEQEPLMASTKMKKAAQMHTQEDQGRNKSFLSFDFRNSYMNM